MASLRRFIPLGAIACALLGACSNPEPAPPAAGDEPAARAPTSLAARIEQPHDRAVESAMRSDLDQVRIAQELFYSANDFTYADDIEKLVRTGLFRKTAGVNVVIDRANDDTWHATATSGSTSTKCTLDARGGAIDCT